MLKYIDLINEAEHAAGGKIDPRVDAGTIVNEAGRYLFSMYAWKWRVRPPAAVDFVADQQYVDLPPDFGFGEVVNVVMSDTLAFGTVQATVDEIAWYRAQTISSPSYYYWALVYPSQHDNDSAADRARLEVYPTPDADSTGAMTVTYRAGWKPLADHDAVANVPPAYDRLLRKMTRAFAVDYATGSGRIVEEIERSTELQRLKDADDRIQSDFGPMRGGILQVDRPYSVYDNWNFTTTGPE